MGKALRVKDGPNVMDVLEVLGLVPPTALGQLLLLNKHRRRPQLRSETPVHQAQGRKRSLEEAAKILKTTVSRIKRIIRIAKTAPAELEHIKWGSGC